MNCILSIKCSKYDVLLENTIVASKPNGPHNLLPYQQKLTPKISSPRNKRFKSVFSPCIFTIFFFFLGKYFHHILVLVMTLFFCLALVHALCKSIAIGPSVKSKLTKNKNKTNGVPHGPIIQRHVAHKKTKIFQLFLLLFYSIF